MVHVSLFFWCFGYEIDQDEHRFQASGTSIPCRKFGACRASQQLLAD